MAEDNSTEDLSVPDLLRHIMAQLISMDGRLQALEAKPYDTRPIWEQALKEILEARAETREQFQQVNEQFQQIHERLEIIEFKLGALNDGLLTMRADQKRLDKRVTKLEGEQA